MLGRFLVTFLHLLISVAVSTPIVQSVFCKLQSGWVIKLYKRKKDRYIIVVNGKIGNFSHECG